ncbi:MAG: hypothetical protein NUW02_00630 [Candidatus Campbellbacteria bacterium]|nr:hypothetical protein [Candidatus Campbellbacteria bacterium]
MFNYRPWKKEKEMLYPKVTAQSNIGIAGTLLGGQEVVSSALANWLFEGGMGTLHLSVQDEEGKQHHAILSLKKIKKSRTLRDRGATRKLIIGVAILSK